MYGWLATDVTSNGMRLEVMFQETTLRSRDGTIAEEVLLQIRARAEREVHASVKRRHAQRNARLATELKEMLRRRDEEAGAAFREKLSRNEMLLLEPFATVSNPGVVVHGSSFENQGKRSAKRLRICVEDEDGTLHIAQSDPRSVDMRLLGGQLRLYPPALTLIVRGMASLCTGTLSGPRGGPFPVCMRALELDAYNGIPTDKLIKRVEQCIRSVDRNVRPLVNALNSYKPIQDVDDDDIDALIAAVKTLESDPILYVRSFKYDRDAGWRHGGGTNYSAPTDGPDVTAVVQIGNGHFKYADTVTMIEHITTLYNILVAPSDPSYAVRVSDWTNALTATSTYTGKAHASEPTMSPEDVIERVVLETSKVDRLRLGVLARADPHIDVKDEMYHPYELDLVQHSCDQYNEMTRAIITMALNNLVVSQHDLDTYEPDRRFNIRSVYGPGLGFDKFIPCFENAAYVTRRPMSRPMPFTTQSGQTDMAACAVQAHDPGILEGGNYVCGRYPVDSTEKRDLIERVMTMIGNFFVNSEVVYLVGCEATDRSRMTIIEWSDGITIGSALTDEIEALSLAFQLVQGLTEPHKKYSSTASPAADPSRLDILYSDPAAKQDMKEHEQDAPCQWFTYDGHVLDPTAYAKYLLMSDTCPEQYNKVGSTVFSAYPGPWTPGTVGWTRFDYRDMENPDMYTPKQTISTGIYEEPSSNTYTHYADDVIRKTTRSLRYTVNRFAMPSYITPDEGDEVLCGYVIFEPLVLNRPTQNSPTFQLNHRASTLTHFYCLHSTVLNAVDGSFRWDVRMKVGDCWDFGTLRRRYPALADLPPPSVFSTTRRRQHATAERHVSAGDISQYIRAHFNGLHYSTAESGGRTVFAVAVGRKRDEILNYATKHEARVFNGQNPLDMLWSLLYNHQTTSTQRRSGGDMIVPLTISDRGPSGVVTEARIETPRGRLLVTTPTYTSISNQVITHVTALRQSQFTSESHAGSGRISDPRVKLSSIDDIFRYGTVGPQVMATRVSQLMVLLQELAVMQEQSGRARDAKTFRSILQQINTLVQHILAS